MRIHQIKGLWMGFLLAVVTGLAGYLFCKMVHSHLLDPLLVALILGIIVNSSINGVKKLEPGINAASSIFIPIGIIFYGLHNLNFAKLTEVQPVMLILLFVVMLVYFSVILLLGKILGQREQITYLTASGSAICGASAIAVTSPAVKAEPDDISISLLSVAMAAFVGFALVLPFVTALFDLSANNFSLLSGSILQFTGLVKVADTFVAFLKKDIMAADMLSLALSVKAVRYLALLVAIPLFSSLIKKKFTVPWFLWAFLAAGLSGTWFYTNYGTSFHPVLVSYVKPVHTISWSIAMSAIGMKADARELLSNNGAKALIMAFAGFFAAMVTFLAGLKILSMF